jgi:hypothetical protein
MEWFRLGFPVFMLIAPAGGVSLWCCLTGVEGARRVLLPTLLAVVGFASVTAAVGPYVYRQTWYTNLWSMGGFFALFWGFGMPIIQGAFKALPVAPRIVSLKPGRMELFRGAFAWPFAAWAAIGASLVWAPGPVWAKLLCAGMGLIGLIVLRVVMPIMAQEPEPTGGADPIGLADQQRIFRRKRMLLMYVLMVVLNLFVAAMPWLGISAAFAGGLIGLSGGLFGVWADARRYLLRKELSMT